MRRYVLYSQTPTGGACQAMACGAGLGSIGFGQEAVERKKLLTRAFIVVSPGKKKQSRASSFRTG